ncbi:MAG: hypothetical protein ACXWXO_10580 [Nocardioides sp.]
MLHIAAATQVRLDTEGWRYYRRKLAEGKTRMEAMRCLKRRIFDAVYRQLLADARAAEADAATSEPTQETGPGGHCGAQPLPGPAKPTLQPTAPPRNATANESLKRAG